MTHLNEYAKRSHKTAVDHGFWEDPDRNFGEMIALQHSELSEALEEHRSDKPPVYFKCKQCGYENLVPKEVHYIPRTGIVGYIMERLGIVNKMVVCPGWVDKPEGAAVELIDNIIRGLDSVEKVLEYTEYTVEDIMNMKMEYNDRRPYKHGRQY